MSAETANHALCSFFALKFTPCHSHLSHFPPFISPLVPVHIPPLRSHASHPATLRAGTAPCGVGALRTRAAARCETSCSCSRVNEICALPGHRRELLYSRRICARGGAGGLNLARHVASLPDAHRAPAALPAHGAWQRGAVAPARGRRDQTTPSVHARAGTSTPRRCTVYAARGCGACSAGCASSYCSRTHFALRCSALRSPLCVPSLRRPAS